VGEVAKNEPKLVAMKVVGSSQARNLATKTTEELHKISFEAS
jgi:hypothetical protein